MRTVKPWKLFVFSLFIFPILLGSAPIRAQQAQGTSHFQGMEPREAIGGILMAGLVGGILGLSTLSFYEKPQDNIRNISIGAGIGMIAVAIYMTYSVTENVKSAPKEKAFLEDTNSLDWALLPNYDFQAQNASAQYVLKF